jgi:hypothetical protein
MLLLVRPALGAVCVHHKVKGSFWRDLLCVQFVYIVMLNVVLERPSLGSVCVHRNVNGSFWRDQLWVLFVYIVMLNVAFGETCVRLYFCTL